MKKITSTLTLLIILVSCTLPKGEFVVKGTVTDESLNGKAIYLSQYNALELLSSDTVIISDKEFQFKGIQKAPAVYYVFMDDGTVSGEIVMGTPLLVKNGKITVDIDGDKVTIGGNKENNAYQRFMDSQYPVMEKLLKLQDVDEDPGEQSNVYVEYFNLLDQLRVFTVNYIMSNIDNPLGEEVFINSYQMLTPNEINEALDLAEESFRSNPVIVEILAETGQDEDSF